MVELTTQLLILENILWLPLCRINKFGLNTLSSKTVAIPYTCGLSRLFSGAVARDHSSSLWVTWDLYLLVTMKNLKDAKTKIYPSTTSGGKELPSSSALDSPSVLSKLATPWCLLRNLLLVDVVGPPSAEVCRTVANFPQVDDLRFINPWEA